MAKQKVQKEKASSSKLLPLSVLAGVVVLLCAVIAPILLPKKMTKAEWKTTLLLAAKAANAGDPWEAHRLAQLAYPHGDKESVGKWTDIIKTVQDKLEPYRVPVTGDADVYQINNFLNEEEASLLTQIYDSAYSSYYLEGALCFDHRWRVEPQMTKSNLSYVDMMISAGVLTKSDFIEQDTGAVTSWCLRAKSATKKNVMRMRSFLNVSRSVVSYRTDSKIVDLIEARVINKTGLPLNKAYYAQLLQYEKDEWYHVHTDCMINPLGVEYDDRIYTILIYLSEPEGGETSFPLLGKDFKPRLGDLVVWRNLDNNGHCNTATAHVAKSVASGVKYVYQKWWKIRHQDHSSPDFTESKNSLSCDRNGACREYLHIRKMPQDIRAKVP
eukprot:TRINITY_DN707_c2_g1_i1.p1 TRINITY_DN707_c2_g1~~TRINITY_DN707_c2_g1_i1.p1  ORF type:complete len:384 (+),score=27.76 TRINITY_DN707_c2_g1_i1:40-1191(+)